MGAYALLVGTGYFMFSESPWSREVRSSTAWQNTLGPLELAIKGHRSVYFAEQDALVIVNEIDGHGPLLVRDFSSLVFRSAKEDETLRGRNVLLTNEGVSAQIWLVDYGMRLNMEPNTLIVLDQEQMADGDGGGLNLSVLSGEWDVERIDASAIEEIEDLETRERIQQRQERARQQKSRNPASAPQLPGVKINDFVKMEGFQAQEGNLFSTEQSLAPSEAKTLSAVEESVDNELWGDLSSSPFEDSLEETLDELAESVGEPPVDELAEVEEKKVLTPAELLEIKRRNRPAGALRSVGEIIENETRYISFAIQSKKGGRAPSSMASAVALSVALNESAQSAEQKELSPRLGGVLQQYAELYLDQGECGMARELKDHVSRHFNDSDEKSKWMKAWQASYRRASSGRRPACE